MGRALVVLVTSALGLAVGLFTLDVARDDPAYSFAGESLAGAAALLVAGWALIACGLAAWVRRPESAFGALLAAAGFAWFVPEWSNPGVGSAAAFTAGLALAAACAPLAGHALLAYPGKRMASWHERAALAFAYAGGVLLLGVLPALAFDPQAQACSQCPANHLAAADDPDLEAGLTRAGLLLALVWAPALALLALHLLTRSGPSARPLALAGAAYLALVAGQHAAALDDGFLANGSLERSLRLAQAAALTGVAAAVAWTWVRARHARSAVARLVVELAESPPPGGLRDALASIAGDPGLVLAYPLDSGGLVDARGSPVELAGDQARTSLVRDGRVVAVLGHEPGRLDDGQLLDEVASAARLALENERLHAEAHARLAELRASRARIVAAGDAERKRLERDLHDGAQQRLVGLALSVRLAQPQAPPAVVARLDEAEAELRAAASELRELAHGIFPAVLSDEGLSAAVEALAEEGGVAVRVGPLSDGRFPAAVETAAYTVVAEVVRAARATVGVRVTGSAGALVVEVETADVNGVPLVQLEDRVGAIDGRLVVARRGGGTTIRVELPCAS